MKQTLSAFQWPPKRLLNVRDTAFEFLSQKWVMIVLTVLPAVILFGFVNLTPILWAVAGSFFEISAFSPEWTFVGLDNFAYVLADSAFWDSIFTASVFAIGSVIVQLVVGISLALLANKSFKGETVVRALVILPYLVPTAILAFVALWMGNSQWGIINQLLKQFGIIQENIAWYGSFDFAMLAVILTSSWKFALFVTIMVLARLQSIPEGLYEAAIVSGATPYQRFRDITLPNIKGVIFIVVLLRGIWMFNKFDIIFVLTGGGPGDVTTTTPIYAYNMAFSQLSIGKAAAISVLLFGLLLIGGILYFHFLEPSQEVRVE